MRPPVSPNFAEKQSGPFLAGTIGRLLKRATTVSAFTALGVALGFLVDVLMVARFGIGNSTDAYFGAYTVPWILVSSMDSFTPMLVAILAAYHSDDPGSEAARDPADGPGSGPKLAFSYLLNVTGLAGLFLALLGILLARPVVAAITPGFAPATADQAVLLARILFAEVPATALATVCRAELYAQRRFALGALGSAIPSLVTVLVLCMPAPGRGIEIAAYAVAGGAMLQALLQMGILFFWRRVPYRPTLRHAAPVLSEAGRLMWAPVAGLLLRQGVTLAERYFGSHLAAGSVTALSYGSRLTTTVAGIAYGGIATASLPSLTQHWTKGPLETARAELTVFLKLMVGLALPLGLTVAALGTPLVRLLFERGQVSHQAALLTGTVLSVYSLSLLSLGPFRAAQNYFYAIKDMRPLVALHGGLTLLTILLDLLLVRPLGAVGLALSISLSSAIIALASLYWLSRGAGNLNWRQLLGSWGRLGVASAAMAAACFWVSRWSGPRLENGGTASQILVIAMSALAGMVVFVAVGSLLQVEALSVLWKMLPKPFGGRSRESGKD